MTVKQLLASLDSRELTEWAAFDAMEPIGEARADLRAGIVASAAANHGFREIKTPYKPRDFMPFLQRDEDDAPVLIRNREQQSALILRMVFNRE